MNKRKNNTSHLKLQFLDIRQFRVAKVELKLSLKN